jgi:hypothetical protein
LGAWGTQSDFASNRGMVLREHSRKTAFDFECPTGLSGASAAVLMTRAKNMRLLRGFGSRHRFAATSAPRLLRTPPIPCASPSLVPRSGSPVRAKHATHPAYYGALVHRVSHTKHARVKHNATILSRAAAPLSPNKKIKHQKIYLFQLLTPPKEIIIV